MKWIRTAGQPPAVGRIVLGLWLDAQAGDSEQRVVVREHATWLSRERVPRYRYPEPDFWMELPASPKASMRSWIRAAQQSPPEWRDVLCCWPRSHAVDDDDEMLVAVWNGQLWVNPTEPEYDYVEPGFWMELPALPAAERRAGAA